MARKNTFDFASYKSASQRKADTRWSGESKRREFVNVANALNLSCDVEVSSDGKGLTISIPFSDGACDVDAWIDLIGAAGIIARVRDV